MDKQQALQIIKETFENPFDKGRFTGFVKNLLNRIDESSFIYKGNYIPDAYKRYIKALERIGKFSDGENSLDILVITLKKETSLERARTMQRNLVAWYLNGSRGDEMKDAALVAYVSPEQADWRFSLVKMDYGFEKASTGKMKVKKELTPARRWSFLVGKNEKSHTAQSRLVNILANDEQAPTLAELENAFDIETVTKEFFLKYRELFLRTKDALDKAVEKDQRIKADFEAKGVDTVNFVKKLLGQIVFLYFLQKKGWFGVGRDDDWGTGSQHFLRSLFDNSEYSNFFNDILEPLFYEALRIDRSHDDGYYSRFNCKIPFLNGGLFDPIGNYDWVHTDINLPNALFFNTRKTKEGDKGDGILDVFDRYNFTVREDEPLEKEMAIDPELLGKAYEKFNAIRPDNFDEFTKALKSGRKGEENKFNKKFGVYYTPREIVHYMCRQSLINYLYTQTEEAGLSTAIKKQDIEDLIVVGELITEHEATALIKQENIRNGIQKSTEYTALLDDSIRENAAAIDQWLEDITVCDPAVGSGAFPVGMMNEIVRARNVLSVFLSNQKRSDYEFKRRCIEHSLYGVDIDPGAVEIAKLRLWLSLVVDEEDIKNIKPLPNLDYKVVCGNSLLGVEKDLFNDHLFNDLEKLKPLFFNETNPAKKQAYKKQIDDLISQITKGHTEFDFEVYFSEIFHEKNGFDVVIANPPYKIVKSTNTTTRTLAQYKKYYSADFKINLFALFEELSIKISSKYGFQSLIVPDSSISLPAFKKMRRFLLSNSNLVEISFFSQAVFDVAQVGKSVILMTSCNLVEKYFKFIEFNTLSDRKIIPVDISEVRQDPHLRLNIHTDNRAAVDLLNKLDRLPHQLDSFCKIYDGINPGSEYTKNEFITKHYIDEHSKKIIDGKDFSRYSPILWDDLYIYYSPKKVNEVRAKLKQENKPFNARIIKREIFFEFPKIVTRQTSETVIATLDEDGYYHKNSVHSTIIRPEFKNTVSLKVLLGILNSKLLDWYYRTISLESGRLYPQVKTARLGSLPIATFIGKSAKEVVCLVEKILSITKDADYSQNPSKQAQVKEYERQIDQMVYELYGLTDEEIKIVEGEGKS